jgi:hypothetical protein
MATHTTVEGTITVGGTAVGSLRTLGLTTGAEMIDATTITSTSKINKVGTKSFSGSAECYWDEADAVQVSLVEGVEVVLVWAFEGTTSGDYIYSGTANVESFDVSASTNGMVECSFSFTGTGPLTRGTA